MVTVQPAVKRIITLIRWSTSPLIVVATMLAGSPAAAQCPDCFHSAMMNDLGPKNRDASKCNGQKYLVLQYDGSLNGKKRQNIDVKVIIQDAMNDWNNATDASGNHVPYKTVFSTDPAITNCGLDVDYTIKLGECAMPTEGLPIAPFACIPNGTNLIHLAEKNFLSKDITTNPMRDINATREDVQGRVAHEIGHPLGLSGNAGCNGPGSAPTIIGGDTSTGRRNNIEEQGKKMGSNLVQQADIALSIKALNNWRPENETRPVADQDCHGSNRSSPIEVDDWVPGGGGQTCGNDDVDEGEECDDGNTDDNDGCSANCSIEDEGECTGSQPHYQDLSFNYCESLCAQPYDPFKDENCYGGGDFDECDGFWGACNCQATMPSYLPQWYCDDLCPEPGGSPARVLYGNPPDANCNFMNDNEECDWEYGECIIIPPAPSPSPEPALAAQFACALFIGGLGVLPTRRREDLNAQIADRT